VGAGGALGADGAPATARGRRELDELLGTAGAQCIKFFGLNRCKAALAVPMQQVAWELAGRSAAAPVGPARGRGSVLRARLTGRPRRAGLLLGTLRALCPPLAGGVAGAAAAAPRSWSAAGPLLRGAAAGDAADAAEGEDAAVGALAGAAREPGRGRPWLHGSLYGCAKSQEDCGRRS